MLAMKDLSCGYGDTAIVRHVNRTVLAGQRIGILGANGQGKSTLVKTIARSLPAIAGEMTEGKGLAIGYFAQQEMDVVQADDTPLQHMGRLARTVGPDAREQELRDFLGKFRFVGEMVHQSVGSLSGGEKARLVLASLVWQRPNLLLLDEPTNHLDLTTREALSMALNEFEGTVMLVSHDRALLREVCDEFWLVAQGKVAEFDGDLDDYQKWLLEVSRAASKGLPPPPLPSGTVGTPAPAPVAAPAAASGSAATGGSRKPAAPAPVPAAAPSSAGYKDDRKQASRDRASLAAQTRPLRNEVHQIDGRLEKLGAEKAAIEADLASGKMSGADIAEAGRRLNHISAEVAMLEERWLALSEQIEAIQAGN
jgi:ATP-binding cassette subfamily F protein 3